MNDTPFFFGNGGGTVKTLADVHALLLTPLTHIEVGSITVKQRPGNTGNVYYRTENGTTVNALGMPNPGIEGYRETLPAMVRLAHENGKELIANIASVEPGDTKKLCHFCVASGVRYIMYNGGCPNVWADGAQKSIISHDPEGVAREMEMIMDITRDTGIIVIFKFSPYNGNDSLRRRVAEKLRPYPIWIAGPNTLPNQYRAREQGLPAIDFPSGDGWIRLGGMGGTDLQHIAYEELWIWRNLLPNHPYISLGGISTGHTIYHRLLYGAKGVQVTSAFYDTDDPHIFSQLLTEYADAIP